MKEIFEKIWKLALPYLKKGMRKDFVLHTVGVVKSMELLLEQEEGDEDILIPAAILHDAGWYNVPEELQKSEDKHDKKRALELHIEYAPPIIDKILTEIGYDRNKIERIIDIVKAHKFQDPIELEKQLLIDADTMADAFKEQFYNDSKAYNKTPEELYGWRKNNKFYTRTAKEIFDAELEKRREEFQ